ncbi:histidine kinase [Pseudopedobacter saltans DSM 12145]|uniref:histidine kinase n=2 Tax=Pseudopedobacter saltans TaxID=151895 RepID=F0SAS3_PSESL|nr:histidine kinase [Pseudopedobacter saltans DSM 12145]
MLLNHLIQHTKTNTNSTFLIVFLVMSCFFQFAAAQDLRVKRLNNDNGLSNSTIECILQDKLGFIWIGTRDGLNKYDGYNIISYKNLPQNNQSISDSYITCIFEDSQNNLWIGTKSGLNLFDQQKGIFTRVDLGKQYKESISKIIEIAAGSLLVATRGNGLFLLASSPNLVKSSKQLVGIKEKEFFDLHIPSDNQIWASTSAGLYRLDLKNNRFEARRVLKQHNINVVSSDKNGILWLGTEDDGIIKYSPSEKTSTHFRHNYLEQNSIGSNQIKALLIDKNQNLWVGTINGGLNKLNTKRYTFSNYTNDPNNSHGLSQRTISALFEDNQGNIWIGTHRGGVNIYSPLAEKFSLQRQSSQKSGLNYNDIKSFYEAKDGSIWIGTDGGGINIWSPNRTSFSFLKNSPFDKTSLGSNEVLDIMADKSGNIYISTWGGGLNKYNKAANSFTRYTNDKNNNNSISGNFVQKAYEDSKGNLWVCTYYNGLNLLDRTTGVFKQLKEGKQNTRLSGNNIVSILEDNSANLWIGTDDGGLNKYNLNTQVFKHYFSAEEKSPDIRVIYQDKQQRLWLGQRGLYLYNTQKDKFEPFCNDCHLSEEFIKGILEDNNGFLWISTSNGLTKLDPRDKSFRKYNTADGLQGLEFEANAALKTKSGEMFFGGINGFNYFYPNNIHFNKFIPPLYLTSFQIFNETILPSAKNSPLKSDISFTKEIQLNYKQSTFSIGFSALNYIAAENNKYEYILEGFDKSWNSINENRKAYYTNVPPGDYIFKVRASNNDDVWNEGTSLAISISPPFWDTWWFKLSVLLLILYIAYLILSFRRNLEIKAIEEKKKEEMHQMQLQFFTNISHELRTPLALIMGPVERLLKEDFHSKFDNLYHTIHNNANRLLNLINELMDFRKVESGHLQLKVMQLNLEAFFVEIEEEFKELAQEKNIDFRFENLTKREEIWADKQILEKITLNLIINAIKYTPQNGSVKLELSDKLVFSNASLVNQLTIKNNLNSKEYLYIKVIDSGIGISKDSIVHLFERYYRITESHMGSGIGLAFVKSLTALHKGNIYVNSERDLGTEIIIALPFLKSDYSHAEIWSKTEESGGVRLESITNKLHTTSVNANIEEDNIKSEKSHKKILVVDDNEEIRTFLKETLNKDYLIFEAENGEQGLILCKEIYPDLIISDVMMPKVNGISFCKQAKDDIDISHIPFMMLTAKTSLEAEIEGKESGADFYFAKPINIDLLEITLRNIFEQQNKLKEHYQKNYQVQAKELVNNARDKEFLEKLLDIIHKNISNTELDIEFLCNEIGMSRTKLYQKVKDITGQAIGDFIRTIRLRKAVEIMSEEDVLLTEVIYRVGIQTQSYFTKAFKKEFNKTPSQFLQELKKNKIK